MDKQTQDKLAEILRINTEIEKLQAQLAKLLNPEKQALPAGFSLTNEVFNVLKESQEALHTRQILQEMKKRHPSYTSIDRKRVASTLAYLKREDKIESGEGRGTYKVRNKTEVEITEKAPEGALP